MDTAARVVTYRDEYRDEFERLNLEWIERYFFVEEADKVYLRNPREKIVDAGGEVFFILDGERIQGTCALIKQTPETYELSKMAVAPGARGRGYGNLLMEAAIEDARRKTAHRIFLLSNTVLAPAIRLYEKYGFRTIRLIDNHPDYKRANIEMALDLI